MLWISISIPKWKKISNMFTIWKIWIAAWMQVWNLIKKDRRVEMRWTLTFHKFKKRRKKVLMFIHNRDRMLIEFNIMMWIYIEHRKISCKVKIWKYLFRKKILFNLQKAIRKEMKNQKLIITLLSVLCPIKKASWNLIKLNQIFSKDKMRFFNKNQRSLKGCFLRLLT